MNIKKIPLVLRKMKYDIFTAKASVPQNYWKNPEDFGNSPEGHALYPEHSEFMWKHIKDLVNKDSSIMEVGCNCGKNLNYLHKSGFTNLHGIDINKHAIKLMKELFPSLYYNSNIKVDMLEDSLKHIKDNSIDLVFSLTVLMHIHTDSEFIFKEIVRIAKDYVVIMEGETMEKCWSHYPRNYKKVFEDLGMKQIKEVDCEEVLPDHVLRVFKK